MAGRKPFRDRLGRFTRRPDKVSPLVGRRSAVHRERAKGKTAHDDRPTHRQKAPGPAPRTRQAPQRPAPIRPPHTKPVRPGAAHKPAKRTRPPKRTRTPKQQRPPHRRSKPTRPKRQPPHRRQRPPQPPRRQKKQQPPKRKRAPKRPPRKRPPPKRKAPKAVAEYAVSVDYKKRAGHGVSAQLSIIGPENASKNDVADAIAARVHDGRNPEGWKIRVTEWRGKELDDSSRAEQRMLFDAFKNFHDDATVDVSDGQSADDSDESAEPDDWESESDEE